MHGPTTRQMIAAPVGLVPVLVTITALAANQAAPILQGHSTTV